MIQSKTVDITPMKITLPVIEMSQYDLGREVIVHMKDGSDWFDLTGYTAKLQGTKPSGFGYTVDGVVDGHDITFASNYDMTSEAGLIPSEVRLTKDGVSLGSLNVILHVEKTPHDVSVTDGSPETIVPEITVLVERAEAAAEVLLDCSAIATTLPAGSNATASYDVDNGVFTFGIPRGNKGKTGDTGATGNGIASITKTGTSGLVDTYTITFTDGTSTTFTVTNGQNGTGSVADVTQNGVSVLDGTTAKVTVPTYVPVTDNEPYLFRQSGNGLDIHNREHDLLVGGSVAWNQLAAIRGNGTVINHGISATFTDGIITLTGANDGEANSNWAITQAGSGVDVIQGHRYLLKGCPSGGSSSKWALIGTNVGVLGDTTDRFDYGEGKILTPIASGSIGLAVMVYKAYTKTVNLTFKPQLFDLTQMLGSTIADAIYAMEQSTAGSGVAFFKKLFPNSYYPYNSGELMSVSGVSSHDMTGFNQWDEVWESGGLDNNGENVTSTTQIRSKNYIPILPSTAYHFHFPSWCPIYWFDDDKNLIERVVVFNNDHNLTSPANAHYARFCTNTSANITTYGHDICINLSWDGSRDGEYEPYVKHSYPLDSSLTLRGIPKLSNGKLYYDGDTYESDGTVTRRFASVDLNTLTWNYDSSSARWQTDALSTVIKNYPSRSDMLISDKWVADAGAAYGDSGKIVTIQRRVFCYSADDVNKPTGNLVYELATPTTETAEPYTNPQIVDEYGTEEYVSTSIVPVGHQTAYPDLFSGDYNDLVNKPTIPTETSQLTNDSDFVIDASYVHTDNNFTTTLKDKLDGIASGAEVNVQSNWNETDSTADAYIANKPDIDALKVLVVTLSAFSSLPATFYETAVTADHVCIKAELGTPSAQTGDWTVTTSAGELNISGSISGSTTATLYLAIKQ